MALIWIGFIVGGFLLGSIMFCAIIPRLFGIEITEISSDYNPGSYNVFKHCGKKMGAVCLTLDVLKGFIPVFLAVKFTRSSSILFALVMIAPVIGHAIGMFNHFHGGKCIAVSFGVLAGIFTLSMVGFVTLAATFIFFSTAAKIYPTRIRSIVVYGIYQAITTIVCLLTGLYSLALGAFGVGMVVIAKHTVFLPKPSKMPLGADPDTAKESKR